MSEEQQANILPEEEPNADKMDIENSLIYKVVAGLMASIIPIGVILWFHFYNKKYLAYYNVSDVKLSYSLEMVLKEIVPGGIVLLFFVFCAYLAFIPIKDLLDKYFPIGGNRRSNESTQTVPSNADGLEHRSESAMRKVSTATSKRRLCVIFLYIAVSPTAFWFYYFTFATVEVKKYGWGSWEVMLAICVVWVILCMSMLVIVLVWLEEEKTIWHGIALAGVLAILIAMLIKTFHINVIEFLLLHIFLISKIMAMVSLYIAIFFVLAEVIWIALEDRVAAYFSQKKSRVKEVHFLFSILCGTFGVLLLLFFFSTFQAQNRENYLVVYESPAAQENGDVIGVAIYQDDTTMIVLPAKISGSEHDFQYELTGDTNYMYVEKSGVVIEQVSKDKIDWKNHLNIG